MPYNFLYLDGLRSLNHHLKDQNYCEDQVLLRMRLPIHAALIVISSSVLHLGRGFSSVFSGILTLDGYKILSGCIDVVSLLVDACAVVIFSAISIFSKEVGIFLSDQFLKVGTTLQNTSQSNTKFEKWCRQIDGIVRGIFALPVGLVQSCLGFVAFTISAEARQLKIVPILFFFALIAPFLGFLSLVGEKPYQYINSMMHIDLNLKQAATDS